MAVLDADLDRARADAAVAGTVTARLLVLSAELDRLLKIERELAERADAGGGDADLFEGADLEEILRTFTENAGGGQASAEEGGADGADAVGAEGTADAASPADPGIDQNFVSALLERQVNTRALEDARGERERLLSDEMALADANARYAEMSSRWIALNSQGDPMCGCSLTRIEKQETEILARKIRLEEIDAAAGEAENALERLRVILHDAVDWVPGDTSAHEPDTAILRIERIQPADPWITTAQVALSRARRALEDIGDLDCGEFTIELFTAFAETCIQGLIRDVAERDGIERALRPVTRTLTTVRALRGHITRSQGAIRHGMEEVRAKRAQLLTRRPR